MDDSSMASASAASAQRADASLFVIPSPSIFQILLPESF